jgi:hypothetical protein
LAWDYDAVAPAFRVDQCVPRGTTCTMAQVASLPGETRTIEIGGLNRNRTYCWQVRLPEGGVSNVVCSP